MADFVDRIRLVVETATGDAQTQLRGVSGSVREAEGAMGKLKAAGGGALDLLKQNAPLALAGAGAAVGAFAKKAIEDFSNLGVAVEDFATATGMHVDEASRWIEVAGDLGVNVDDVTTAVGKLNRADLSQLGITTHDANEKFLQTIAYLNGIDDSRKLAQEGMRIFGRSWQNLAPLIAHSAELRDRLKEVSDQKVFTQDKVDKALQYRDAMDNLHDAVDDVSITLAENLAPAISQVADSLAPMVDGLGTAIGWVEDFEHALEKPFQYLNRQVPESVRNAASHIPILGKLMSDTGEKAAHAADQSKDLADATGEVTDAAKNAKDAIQSLTDTYLQGEASTLRMKQKTKDLVAELQSGKTDTDKMKSSFVDLAQAMEQAQGPQATIQTLQNLKLYVAPGSELSRYLDGLIAHLRGIMQGGSATYTVNVAVNSPGVKAPDGSWIVPPRGNASGQSIGAPPMPAAPAAAAGGDGASVEAFGAVEAFGPSASSTVYLPGTAAAWRGGGPVTVTNVTVHTPPSTRPVDVVDALNRWANGRGATTTRGATGL